MITGDNMQDIAIQVNSLSKAYKLYEKPIDRLKESLHPLKKKYHKDFFALKDVSFIVKRGETLGVIGKNGSGKSTLLKIITGVLSPTNGSIEKEGRISALLELGAGFNPEFTGIQNIYLNGTMMGYTKEEVHHRIEAILDFADIGDFIYQPVKTYSSGMFVRLAFAVAINVDPDILIVDEALSVGDIFFQLKCYKKFEEFKKNKKTIIFVTHEMGSIIKYCNRAIVLNNGVKIAEGEPNAMVDVYKKVLVNCHYEQKKSNESEKFTKTLWKEKMEFNPSFLEYGNKRAEIIDFGVFGDDGDLNQVLLKEKNCTFKLRIKFNETIKHPIFAFTIKDIKGTEIVGTNTMVELVNTGIVKKENIVEVVFEQKMILQGGQYLLSFGCTGFEANGEFVVYHRLYDIFRIEVISAKNTVGYFDINSKIEIEFLIMP